MAERNLGLSSFASLPERGVLAEAGKKSIPVVHKAAVTAMRKNYLRKALNAAIEIYKVCCELPQYQFVSYHTKAESLTSMYFARQAKQLQLHQGVWTLVWMRGKVEFRNDMHPPPTLPAGT